MDGDGTTTRAHPLAPLDEDELRAAVALVAEARSLDPILVSTVHLDEPTKEELAGHERAERAARRAKVLVVTGPTSMAVAIVDLDAAELRSWRDVEDVRPPMLLGESFLAICAIREDHRWLAAMARRGITDLEHVQLDPWPPGTFGLAHEAGRRVTRVLTYLRHSPTDNGYAHPVEGLTCWVDLATAEVLDVVDLGADGTPGSEPLPIPSICRNYGVDDNGPMRTDLRPIEIHQPEGVSFTVDGNEIRWQNWRLRASIDPLEGLVLHTVSYTDGDRVRPILHRAALSEMVVPYGAADPQQGWKNAFDAGEWGIGRFVNPLALDCDCLGAIHYLHAAMPDESGGAFTVENAICIHEEDFSLLWKHRDLHTDNTEVRRQRRLVVSAIFTVGNYEYGFYWYFYLDGTLQLEVKLTGIIQPQGVAVGAEGDHPNANPIDVGIVAPHHQHLFCVRMDLDVDGPTNTVVEVNAEPAPTGPDNPLGNAIVAVASPLRRESEAIRDVHAASSRHWRITNPTSLNHLGRPVAYKLLPASTPTLLASAESMVARRAGFAQHNLWVTPFDPAETRAAGDFPNQSGGGDGLPRWTAADRSIEATDVVVWHTFGVTHLVRPEDWPVMPVEVTGFSLIPVGFFDRNPSLDVPPTPKGASCHAHDAGGEAGDQAGCH